MNKFITGGNVNYVVRDWGNALLRLKKYQETEDLALLCILQYASDGGTVEAMQAMRVKAAMGLGKPAEALVRARELFNLSSLQNTAAALATISECLEAAHPGDPAIVKQFKQEQMAGAGTQPTSQPAGGGVMASIKLDGAVYERKLKDYTKLDYGTLCAKGNLLLLSGRATEAREAFERAYEMAPENELQKATENIAKAIKAEDGTIGRANKFVLELRPKKP